jgi:hypothetical protein
MSKRYFFQVPNHVSTVEAANLFEFMATGETNKTEYLDERNQIIHDNLELLINQIGRIGTQDLVSYLTEYKLLDIAGGTDYVKKVFNCLELEEAIC